MACNDDDDCTDILSHCNKMPFGFSGKKGVCVFQSCQTIININSSTKEQICPTIGNECTEGSLSGNCIRGPLTCRYQKVLTIAKCGKKWIN